jgi:hypothetical protein
VPHLANIRLARRARGFAVAALLALAPAEARAQSAPAAPGVLVTVGGHRMHFLCAGTGGPVVVVEAGLGDFSTD